MTDNSKRTGAAIESHYQFLAWFVPTIEKFPICGGPAAPRGKDYIACSAARRQGTCTNRASIRRGEVEAWITESLRHELMAPHLVSEFVRAFNDEINRTRRDRDQRREGLQREQRDLERRIDTLLDAFASGALRRPSVQAKLKALESRQTEVAAKLAGLMDEPVRLDPNLAATTSRRSRHSKTCSGTTPRAPKLSRSSAH